MYACILRCENALRRMGEHYVLFFINLGSIDQCLAGHYRILAVLIDDGIVNAGRFRGHYT